MGGPLFGVVVVVVYVSGVYYNPPEKNLAFCHVVPYTVLHGELNFELKIMDFLLKMLVFIDFFKGSNFGSIFGPSSDGLPSALGAVREASRPLWITI